MTDDNVVNLTFISAQGNRYDVKAEPGLSVMRAALDNGIDGIAADCGGTMTCGTCHIYIGQPWRDRLKPISDDEEATIEFAVDTNENSRLSCQVIVSPALNGLVVNIPKSQF